jgi:hypothetical protein
VQRQGEDGAVAAATLMSAEQTLTAGVVTSLPVGKK